MSEQEDRKQRSEKLLEELGSGFLPSLPLIESEEECQIRTPEEIGSRILCLVGVAAAADGLEKKRIIDWFRKESLLDKLSPSENAFLTKQGIEDRERIRFSWKSECIWLLLWASGEVDRSLPTESCSVQEILARIPSFGSDTSLFINSIELRPKKEILDLSDFLYRAHWATRQNGLDGSIKIGKLNPDVVPEWHHAVNWLTCYDGIDNWDEVTTDT
jgi:hypothetical protein